MRTLNTGCIFRPHVLTTTCWCRPEVEYVDEGDTIGSDTVALVAHRFLEPRPDAQERMAVFSEQMVRSDV